MFEFGWDSRKALANLGKHGVSFQEALTVFHDALAIQFFDSENSQEEERFLMPGMSCRSRLLLLCHTERDGTIRIISARRATRSESTHYRGQLQ